MEYLLDTHAAIYFLRGDARLSTRSRAIIDDPAKVKLFSHASLWEIAIKTSIGKLKLKTDLEAIPVELLKWNIQELDIRIPHFTAVAAMPFHHRDPFDRLLVAQCQVEGLRLLSNDKPLDAYGIQRIW